MSPSLRLAVIGAGSSYAAVLFAELHDLRVEAAVEVALYDRDRASTHRAAALANVVAPELTVRACDELSRCLEGADVVVHVYRAGPADYRRQQELEARRLGLVGQETQGFGGAASAMCNIAALRPIAEVALIERPDALHLFITNPTGVMTAAGQRLGLRAAGLCELPYVLHKNARAAAPSATQLDYIGLNHFGWVVGGRASDGTDCTAALLSAAPKILAMSRPRNIPRAIPERVIELFAAIPSPYLAYYYATADILELQETEPTRAEHVQQINQQMGAALQRRDVAGALNIARDRGGYMLGKAMRAFLRGWVGVEERELILCLTDHVHEAFAEDGLVAPEMPTVVSARTVRSRPVRADLHSHLRAMLTVMEACESLLVGAGLDNDLDCFEAALITHPLVRSPGAARALREFHETAASPQPS